MALVSATASGLGPGASQVLTVSAVTFTASYTCTNPADTQANAWLEGSVDGTTFFPLRDHDSITPAQTGTGARFYRDQPVTAVKAHASCSTGSTVTVTVAGE